MSNLEDLQKAIQGATKQDRIAVMDALHSLKGRIGKDGEITSLGTLTGELIELVALG